MKKTPIVILVSCFAAIQLPAQSGSSIPSPEIKGKNNAVSFGAILPIGEFSRTHFAGVAVNYSWSHHRFGQTGNQPGKLIDFLADGGMNYYFGKNETVAGYKYKYGGYIYLHAFGGAIYNFSKKGNIALTGGPGMGIYKGGHDWGLGASLSGSYYVGTAIAFTPEIVFFKHNEAAALWSGGIRAAYMF
ncbi:MAG: hypothetical protein Q8941_17295 [Bacteroidota bacterium]|nr:hypothetical protein [Bacteroidota bacterium]